MAGYDDLAAQVQRATSGQNTWSNDSDAAARRVRLRPKPGGASIIYGGNGLLQPLRKTNGLVWPYQPLITYTQPVQWNDMRLIHTNQEILSYERTPAPKFEVRGRFSVQNQQEGIYALAAIHFLRTVSKMHFGSSDPLAGTPPPVLLFDAYGQYMFNQLPVVVTQWSHGLPDDVDYVPIDLTNIQVYSNAQTQTNISGVSRVATTPQLNSYDQVRNSALMTGRMFRSDLGTDQYIWLPAVFELSVSLTVQNSATKLKEFNLAKFTTGELMKGGGWI
jgi:hypothetical protein